MTVGTGQISMAEIYEEIYGVAPSGQFSLDDLVQAANNFPDKTPPHAMNDFLGYQDIEAPSAPSNVNATQSSSNSNITITWTDNSDNETGFRIERSVNSGSYSLVTTVSSNTTSYTDTGAKTKGNTYRYRVRAFNSEFDSAFATGNLVTLQGIPSSPSSLSASLFTGDDISLSWNDNSNDESGFRIFRSFNGGLYSLIHTTGPNTESYTDDDPKDDGDYRYQVLAFNSYGESSRDTSNIVTVDSGGGVG
jgi:hypothetical protein